MKPQIKIAIANRGEVAFRIHRAIKKLGYTSVLLHSTPDKKTLAYRVCDETWCIGPGPSKESYLNIEAIIAAAKKSKATALHPGFGFLSENPEFAKACKKNGIIFIGPEPESMELFGDKISAKAFCEKQDVPTLKSYHEKNKDTDLLLKEAKKITFPLLIKASAGGGGRGMRVVENEQKFLSQLEAAKNESLKAFGSDTVFLEKYLPDAKHIEVQVFGTHNKTFILGERECSVQRRHQKIIEEALSASLTPELREKIYSYAKRLIENSNYLGAGTVEFLFDGEEFYFLEVNTRLQVEHPVTEEVYGVDLVTAQINLALDDKIPNWDRLTPKNHSIECRIYAESPKGIPSTGKLGTLEFPLNNPRIRIESGFAKDDIITPFYDSMIAKVICTSNNRLSCIKDLTSYLQTVVLVGIESNIPLLLAILNHQEFLDSTMTTQFFSNHFSEGIQPELDSNEVKNIIQYKTFNQNNLFSQGWWNPNFNSKIATDTFVETLEEKTWLSYKGTSYFIDNLGVNRLKKDFSIELDPKHLSAPMPGQIVNIFVSKKDSVKKGDPLFIVEAMKMEHTINASRNGFIKDVHFKKGDSVSTRDVIIELEEDDTNG